jgi:putative glutamine amidotransferase
MRKIYVVGGDEDYANWMDGEVVDSIDECDLVVFTGGEDVDPFMYGEARHLQTSSNLRRDIREKVYFDKAVELGKHIIGICRGSQFVCAMSGGKLVQHQSNPSGWHSIETFEKNHFFITSTHHQAQYPYNLSPEDYRILAWTQHISPYHLGGDGKEMSPLVECEIVYYPKTKSLGIQGHPEYFYIETWNDMPSREIDRTDAWLRGLLDLHMKDEILDMTDLKPEVYS